MKRTVRNSLLALLVGVAAANGAVVNGAAAQDVQGRNWAGACTGCHGTEGRSVGAIPAIAGIEKAKFVRLMTSFRDGKELATIMHQLAKGLTDQQIDAIGDYFASRKPR